MTQREEPKFWQDPFVILITIIIGSVIVFLPVNDYALHYGNVYNIIAVLMLIPALFIVTVMRFLP